ncbi:ABC transporter substrate-binding protein [Camelimonas abortus]|uniref:ABC transporter substrate-binding protein n=1 Tax=Camelimonas abortus TaxID=1017184 RepID=A0ABV7LB97_9HYPH
MKQRLLGALCALALAAPAFTTQAEAEAGRVSDDVIRIVVMNDQSSAYSDTSGKGSVVAAQLAIEDHNKIAAGKPVELISVDHQLKVDVALAHARKLIDQDRVDAFMDLANSGVSLAIQQLARENDKIAIHVGSAHADLYGKACSPNGALWLYDSYSLAKGLAKALLDKDHDRWFLLTADYAFGHAMQEDMSRTLLENGGKIVGAVRAPIATTDYSSYLMQAMGQDANVLALLNAGADTTNSIKQAAEFGVAARGVKLAVPIFTVINAHGIGPELAQGAVFLAGYYWDADDESRAFAKRYAERMGRPPAHTQAAVYSAVSHYLKAIDAAGSDDAKTVMAKMRELPINDFMTKNGRLREDGRVIRDMLLLEVKAPSEVKSEWDLAKVIRTVPGDEMIRPLDEGGCDLVKK